MALLPNPSRRFLHLVLLFALGIAGVSASQSAVIELYPAVNSTTEPFPPSDKRCTSSFPSTSIDLKTDTCLHGDYYVNRNLKITSAPKCADDSKPVLLYYSTNDCTDPYIFRDNGASSDVTGKCLFDYGTSPWSLIYRCGDWTEQGADDYQSAKPPSPSSTSSLVAASIVSEFPTPSPTNAKAGWVTTYSNSGCERKDGTRLQSVVAVDELCLPLDRSMVIDQTPVCNNGTRALLAMYKEAKCYPGNPSANVLKVIKDSMIDKCLETEDYASMLFWCSGQPGLDPTRPGPGKDNSLAIGFGVGLGLPLALIFTVGLWFFLDKRAGRKLKVCRVL